MKQQGVGHRLEPQAVTAAASGAYTALEPSTISALR